MRVVIAAVGRLKAGPERELAERYRLRAAATGRALGISAVEIVEVRESRARAPDRRVVEETIALAGIIPENAIIAALDGRGRNLTSESFAAQLRTWRAGAQALCFAIGGADGLGAAFCERAELIVAFGSVTWPHQLVRIMLLEQIYRGFTILSGHPYHRE